MTLGAASRTAAVADAEVAADFTLIIPAHNEAQVIERCLRGIIDTAPLGMTPEIIVAANGCNDETVGLARKAAPSATVIDLKTPSKSAAINNAHAIATRFPTLIMDADVECDFLSLSSIASKLRDGSCLVASPRLRINFQGCSRWVRSYYRIWSSLPYAMDGLIGGGVYGVSGDGAKRVFPLPDVIGDDLYVRTRFARHERCNIAHEPKGQHAIWVTMSPPRGLKELIAIEARRRMGKYEVDRNFPTDESGSINRRSDLLAALNKPQSWWDLVVYIGVKLAALGLFRLNLLRGRKPWLRDTSSRTNIATKQVSEVE